LGATTQISQQRSMQPRSLSGGIRIKYRTRLGISMITKFRPVYEQPIYQIMIEVRDFLSTRPYHSLRAQIDCGDASDDFIKEKPHSNIRSSSTDPMTRQYGVSSGHPRTKLMARQVSIVGLLLIYQRTCRPPRSGGARRQQRRRSYAPRYATSFPSPGLLRLRGIRNQSRFAHSFRKKPSPAGKVARSSVSQTEAMPLLGDASKKGRAGTWRNRKGGYWVPTARGAD
jgi:hypothetical protein